MLAVRYDHYIGSLGVKGLISALDIREVSVSRSACFTTKESSYLENGIYSISSVSHEVYLMTK